MVVWGDFVFVQLERFDGVYYSGVTLVFKAFENIETHENIDIFFSLCIEFYLETHDTFLSKYVRRYEKVVGRFETDDFNSPKKTDSLNIF